MNYNYRKSIIAALVLLTCMTIASVNAADVAYDTSGKGTRLFASNTTETRFKVLVEAQNLGSDEVEVAEITMPAGLESEGHSHNSIEIFYVLSGRMRHVVNGESSLIEPGMVAIVRPGDTVVHKIPENEPCRALVIWAPGGEIERLQNGFSGIDVPVFHQGSFR